MWYIYAIISGLSSALMAIIINAKLKEHDALLMTSLFCMIMTTLFIIACFASKKFEGLSLKNVLMTDVIALVFTGFFAGLGYLSYFLALKHGPLNYVVAIDRLSVVYVAVLSIIILQSKFNIWHIVGAVCMVIGAYLIGI